MADGSVRGADARCVAMLEAMKAVVNDYATPQDKALERDLHKKVVACLPSSFPPERFFFRAAGACEPPEPATVALPFPLGPRRCLSRARALAVSAFNALHPPPPPLSLKYYHTACGA